LSANAPHPTAHDSARPACHAGVAMMPSPAPFPTPAPAGADDHRRLARITAAVAVTSSLLSAATSEAVLDSSMDQLRDGRRSTGGVQALSGLASAGALLSLALLIVVTWRLAKTHQRLGRPGTRWSPGWAIAGRLIPVASVVLPALQIDELWRGSTPDLAPGAPDWRSRPRTLAIVALFARSLAGFVVAVVTFAGIAVRVVDRIGDGRTNRDDLADALSTGRGLRVAGAVLGVVTMVLTAWLLVRIAERQHRLAATPVAPPAFAAGWYPDPWGRFPARWWNGTGWDATVWSGGTTAYDPGPVGG
jgi:hypothetical protein